MQAQEHEAKLAEYKALRDELLQFNQTLMITLNFLFLVGTAASGALFQAKPEDLASSFPTIYFLAITIIFGSFYICWARLQGVFRIGSYIQCFLEEDTGLEYERRLRVLRRSLGQSEISYTRVILGIHLMFYLVVVMLFYFKGVNSGWHIMAFATGLPFVVHALLLYFTTKRERYEAAWRGKDQTIKGRRGH